MNPSSMRAARSALATFALLAGSLSALHAQSGTEPAQRWALELQPLAERFERASDVRLLLTVRNVGTSAHSIALPYRSGAAWPQWIGIERDGLRLESAADHDFAAEPALLAPGEQMSVFVDLAPFLSRSGLGAAGPGAYTVRWDGGTIGLASSASASFVVTGAPLATPAPSSLEAFLAPARPGESELERVRSAWSRFAATPNDPRAIAFAAALPPERIDALSIFEVLEATRDVGVRRALVALLGEAGKDEVSADRLIAFLRKHPDPSLASLGSEALERMR